MTDGSPPTASDRIAAIRAAMTDDAEAGATFGETVRASVQGALDRLDAIVGAAPHAEAATLLQHLRDRVSGLDPARLEPRRGLGGLFDSRGKRLKAFRAAYLSTADAASSSATDLADRGGAIARRSEDLEALWTELRAGVSDLDDHLHAGRAWLADRNAPAHAPLPPEAAAAFEDAVELAAPPEETSNGAEADPVEALGDNEAAAETVTPADPSEATADVDVEVAPEAPAAPSPAEAEPGPNAATSAGLATLPHPLDARLTALAALRARAVAALPRIRALQNADHAAPAALASARNGVEAWSGQWREALGLSGRKPKKVRPDGALLVETRDALVGRLTAAERVLATAQARLAELTPRTHTPPDEVRAAA